MQTAFLYFGLAGLAASLPLVFLAWIWRTGSHPVLEALSRVRRRSVLVQLALLAFVVNLIVYGSVKTSGSGRVEGGVTNGPSGLPPPMLQMPAGNGASFFGFTADQIAAGFALSEVGHGGSWDFDPPASATVVSDWRLRGAADDWRPAPSFAPVSDAPAVFADGRVQDRVRGPSLVFAPLNAALGVVPEANWGMVAGSNAESMVWCATTASNTLVVTWRDVLLNRDTNSPVSVQAEFFDDGGFVYRYDLSRAASALSDPSVASNILVGAWFGGAGESVDVAGDADASAMTSVSFRALDPADAVLADRDGDGMSTYDEIFTHRTDPGLYDSDGDGIGDGDEIAQSLDPLAVSVSNEALLARLEDFQTNMSYAAAAVAVTNELVGYRLWDSFAAAWPAGATNLVYERTVRIDRQGGWEQYFLSSRPDAAGGWSLDGLVLEWEDSCGESGAATASPAADSLYLPLSTNGPSSVTFRLRATAASLRSARPVYLVGYSPVLAISGGSEHVTSSGRPVTVFLDGANSEIGVSVDRSRRPCRAALHPRELSMCGVEDIADVSGGAFRYEGGVDGGRIVASGPGVCPLPDATVAGTEQVPPSPPLRSAGGAPPRGRYLVVLAPWVSYGTPHRGVSWDGEWYSVEREYPLGSGCLAREWRRDATGGWTCDCAPGAGCGLPDGNEFVSVGLSAEGDVATAQLTIGDDVVWRDSAAHVVGSEAGEPARIETVDDCGECEGGCESGDCSGMEGPDLNSLKFRVPLGVARKNQVAGFAYFETDGPMRVSPASFRFIARGDVGASVTTNGASRTASCTCAQGRTLLIEPVADGVRVTVRKQATGELEHTWAVENVDGSPCEVRIVQRSRLDNVMQDWTYEYAYDGNADDWTWRATDNVAGVREELFKADALNEDGSYSETRVKYGVDGAWLGEVETVSRLVGERERAVLRGTYRREATGFSVVERFADYWRDDEHPARNGKLRLLRADDAPWEYHEWTKDGLEVLRVEQRNGSAVPEEFPSASSNGFENASGLADAFLTTYSYAPLDGDDARSADRGKARCESRYVVRNGAATLVGRTWRRYTGVSADGLPAVREETWRASSAESSFGDAACAYSWRTAFDDTTPGAVPLVLRGETAEEMDEDGVRVVRTVAPTNGCVVATARKWRGGAQFPTYEVATVDETFGRVLRTETRLADGGAVIGGASSVYDDKGRLRFESRHDGTWTTNAYSCCRLLWSRDREGRKTLRSAVTGRDRLYYAEEEVWLQDVASSGYKVTQHFFDGLGRETNTVVYVGTTPGEAVDPAASDGRRLSEETSRRVWSGYDYSESVDARGRFETRSACHMADRDVVTTSVYAGEASESPSFVTVETETRNGMSSTRREWDGKWTERRTWSDYDAAGRMVEFDVTESSDRGVVTNSVVRRDFLGRTVSVEEPAGTTTTAYDGATERAVSSTWSAGTVSRVQTNVYDALGRPAGSVRDGVTSRSDETYEQVSNVWWKVTRSAVFAGAATNSAGEVRERVTGLSDAVRSQVVRISADGAATETTVSYDPVADVSVETTLSPTAGAAVRTSRHGLLISVESPDGTTEYAYDALGRKVGETCGERISETAYSAAGDVVARRTRTGEGTYAEESYAYDTFGNCVAETNALGCATTASYDAMGNVVEVSGATYPVRFEYDTEGRRTLLSTTRDGTIWDVTTWEYDPATGRRTAKRYADGSLYATSYTPDGLESVVTRPSLQWKENIYDAQRRLVGVMHSSPEDDYAIMCDVFGRATNVANATGCEYRYEYGTGDALLREETVAAYCGTLTASQTTSVLVRSFDAYARPSGYSLSVDGVVKGGVGYSYGDDGLVSDVFATNVEGRVFAVAYSNLDARCHGYAIMTPGGATIRRVATRDMYRRDLLVSCTMMFNGNVVDSHEYTYDNLSRPTTRTSGGIASSFAYNDRNEVVSAQIGTNLFTHAYDYIGNQMLYAANAETNVYTHNGLNQIETVTVPQSSALNPPYSISYDIDGNLTNDSVFVYSYDSENRLASVASNGVVLVSNQYDYRGRRIRKTTPTTETTFVYDGWNLIHENVCEINGATTNITEIQYVFGADLSETFQGAGGVGGLLATSVNGQFYTPAYDNNGNVTKYIDEFGNIVASYEYDDFGRMISQCGTLADFFRIRFSTKYFDLETGLYYYGYRFYSPTLMRWLNRDPIGEEGGENLYRFCNNNSSYANDYLGLKWKISREPSKRWAIARKTSNSDTCYDLATQLRLDASESDRWMRQLNNDKCAYEIPNVFCVYTSKSKWGDGVVSFVTHLKRVAASDAKQYLSEGFMVVSHEWANSEDSFCSMWKQNGIYAISFAGHGSEYGFIADNSSGMAIGPDAVHPPYRLAAVRAYTCLSSVEIPGNATLPNGSIPKYSWKNHVSAKGTFVGYSGSVNWISQLWQREAINE